MSQNRKVKATIEATFKRIEEGIAEFEEIWERVYSSTSQAQKEKYEGDLKKQIKKLQRYRESLKAWMQSADTTVAQFCDQIADAKKNIEDRMAQFRECEKETKTKAFSKEGLKQPSKVTPQDEKREEVLSILRQSISSLHKEIEECEVEEKKEKNRKKNANQIIITKLETFIKNHHWHISKLELVLRQLDNEILDPYEMETIIDGVDSYLRGYRERDFLFDDSMYDEYDLETSLNSDDELSDDSSDIISLGVDGSETSTPAPLRQSIPSIPSLASLAMVKPKPSPVRVAATPIDYSQVMLRAASSKGTMSPAKASPILRGDSQPPQTTPLLKPATQTPSPVIMPTPAVVATAVSKPAVATPLKQGTPSKPKMGEKKVEIPLEPSFIPPRLSLSSLPVWTRAELVDMISSAYAAANPLPSRRDCLYFPAAPATVPDCFPQVPSGPTGDNLNRAGPESLLFGFAYGDVNEKMRCSSALSDQNWAYCRTDKYWFSQGGGVCVLLRCHVQNDSMYDYNSWSMRPLGETNSMYVQRRPVL